MIKSVFVVLSILLVSGGVFANEGDKLKKEVSEYAQSFGFKTDDPNEMNSYGESKVMIFLKKGWIEGAKYLLENGYDLSIKNKRGETAYDYAIRMGISQDQIQEFKASGVNSKFEQTPSERNIRNKQEAELNILFSSRLKKEHCYDPYEKSTFHADINDDGIKDLVWFYGIGNCEGNFGSVSLAIFKGDGGGAYTETGVYSVRTTSDVDFKSSKIKSGNLYFTENYRLPSDANCCPSGERNRVFSLKEFKLLK